jgi:hypothetical protein
LPSSSPASSLDAAPSESASSSEPSSISISTVLSSADALLSAFSPAAPAGTAPSLYWKSSSPPFSSRKGWLGTVSPLPCLQPPSRPLPAASNIAASAIGSCASRHDIELQTVYPRSPRCALPSRTA